MLCLFGLVCVLGLAASPSAPASWYSTNTYWNNQSAGCAGGVSCVIVFQMPAWFASENTDSPRLLAVIRMNDSQCEWGQHNAGAYQDPSGVWYTKSSIIHRQGCSTQTYRFSFAPVSGTVGF